MNTQAAYKNARRRARGEGYRFHSRVKKFAKKHLNRKARRAINRGSE